MQKKSPLKNSQKGWSELIELISQIESPKQLSSFFDLLLTIEEKETFASRFLIIRSLLEAKLTQREMAEKFKISISQITRGSNALKIIDDKLKEFLISKM